MAAIALAPIVLNAATLSLVLKGVGTADNYEGSVSSAVFNPTTTTVAFKGIGGGVVNVAGAASWVLDMDYAQDWATAKSLAQFLFDNAGKVATAVLKPTSGGAGFTADVVLVAGPAGGAADALATGSVSLGVNGQPVKA
jgi:hypothetical protein